MRLLVSLVIRDALHRSAPQDEGEVQAERWIAASGSALLAMTKGGLCAMLHRTTGCVR